MRKYSEKYILDYDTLRHAVIGFEFEFYSNQSYYKTLENLNVLLSPIKVHGFRLYHPDYEVDKDNFILTPDLSGGSSMAELVTGPLPYYEAKNYFFKIMKYINDNCYTNEKASIHINLSFDNKEIGELNILKEILTIDEETIYKDFPTRKNNIYAKSIKKIIPYKDYDFSSIDIDTIKNILKVPEDKYYGINFIHLNKLNNRRVEFRYLGGKDYQKKVGEITDIMDNFIITTYNNINAEFNNTDIENLSEYLEQNINSFKNYTTFDKFLSEFSNVYIQVDKNGLYDVVNSYYDRIYPFLQKFLDGVEELTECRINYITQLNKVEIVDAEFKTIMNLTELDFIECKIQDGIFEDCTFVNCDIDNVQITKSKIHESEVKESKILNTNVMNTDLTNCYFVGGILNGHMEGGVFRSGTIAENGSLSTTTKIVKSDDNFFNTKFDDGNDVGGKKGDGKMKK